MSGIVLSDGFYDLPRYLGLTLNAYGLHIKAMSYCAKWNVTHVTYARVRTFGTREEIESAVEELTAEGLWEVSDEGDYFVHNVGISETKAES